MKNTEELDPIDLVNSAKTDEARAAEAAVLTTIAKPLIEATGVPPVVEENTKRLDELDSALKSGIIAQAPERFSSFNNATEHFDDIAHVMRVVKELGVGGTAVWEYLSHKLIAEGKRISRG